MPDWEERISQHTNPAIRVEHDLRYRLVAPLIRASSAWADLGCGNGTAAADALHGEFSGRAVLIDVDNAAVARAAASLAAREIVQLTGDLAAPETLERTSEAILAVDGPRTITCFEVIEHLDTFVPLIEWAVRLTRERDVTFVMSVPNDAFWSIENPYHRTMWGEGAFAELRALLPDDHVVLRQIALTGSVICRSDDEATATTLPVERSRAQTVPTHFIAAFGPRASEIVPLAAVASADPVAQRLFERQREADLAYLMRSFKAVDRENGELVAQIRKDTKEFDDWRAYIRRLEAELGIEPPSGEGTDKSEATWTTEQQPR